MLSIVADIFLEELLMKENGIKSSDVKIRSHKVRELRDRFQNECNRELSMSAIKGNLHHIIKTGTRKLPKTVIGMFLSDVLIHS